MQLRDVLREKSARIHRENRHHASERSPGGGEAKSDSHGNQVPKRGGGKERKGAINLREMLGRSGELQKEGGRVET